MSIAEVEFHHILPMTFIFHQVGTGVAQMVEPRTHVVKCPELESGLLRTNIRQSYISEAVIVGCTFYTHP